MAFGHECARCGYIETAHTFSAEYPGACHRYVSPDVVELPRARRSDNLRARAHDRPVAIIPFAPRNRMKISAA
jgi:hypothetical protein